ncbi:MAG: RdgB/HAM1 family non-canonical purine NTP pyrophosphatase [Bauldia sp.]
MSLLKRGDKLVFATHNAAKIREIDELIAPFQMTVASAAALGLPEPEETGATFEENALLKAVAAANGSGHPSLADDSGIVVDALGGEPGIYSARWAGPNRDFADAMQRIEDRLVAAGATTPEKRTARFVAVLALALPDGRTETFRGEVEGHLVWPPRGPSGFGYDPMFVPDGQAPGHARTFGEMEAHEKRSLSHRARAFAAFAHTVFQ